MERFKMRVAVHLILREDNKILLLKRKNTGFGDGNYSVVAGHLDGNETVKQAMKREAYEEAGILVEEKDLEIVHVMHTKLEDESIYYFIYCDKYKGNVVNNEPNKCDELSFYDVNYLPDNIIDYVKVGIYNYSKEIYFSSYGF